jgi:preprotein translocase subunit YajC
MRAELVPLLAIVAVFYFLLIRPGQSRAKSTRATLAALEPGARIMTTAGLYATVLAVEDDAIVLETSPGTTSRWAKAAVAKILPDGPETGEPPAGSDDGEDDSR